MTKPIIKPCVYCGKPRGIKRLKTCLSEACQRQRKLDLSRRHDNKQRELRRQSGLPMITCQVCKGQFESLGGHLELHGMDVTTYLYLFPGSPIITGGLKRIRGLASPARASYSNYDGRAPDDYLQEFMVGCLLGDGSLEHKKVNARYAEGGSNQAYLKWKHEVLSEYFNCTFRERLSSPHVKTGKRYLGWWLRTSAHPVLTELHRHWYVGGRKIVPLNLISQHLTAFSLAVWFCDDGHLGRYEALFYTMAFSMEEVEFLQGQLSEKFNLEAKIRRNSKGQSFLALNSNNRRRLAEMLYSFHLPGMEYKYTLDDGALALYGKSNHNTRG